MNFLFFYFCFAFIATISLFVVKNLHYDLLCLTIFSAAVQAKWLKFLWIMAHSFIFITAEYLSTTLVGQSIHDFMCFDTSMEVFSLFVINPFKLYVYTMDLVYRWIYWQRKSCRQFNLLILTSVSSSSWKEGDGVKGVDGVNSF